MAAPAQFTEYIDKNADKFIERLAKAVAIPRLVRLHECMFQSLTITSYNVPSIPDICGMTFNNALVHFITIPTTP
jgi:hypothetical protein